MSVTFLNFPPGNLRLKKLKKVTLISFSVRLSALKCKQSNRRWQFCHNPVPFVLIRGKNISMIFFLTFDFLSDKEYFFPDQ
ncbi:MAG: hypothetical protein B6245_23325 [Desulfobacteraceae bacterium 4572_88]|nr:MAG: hypothetical protein B6245_23325 [Desulfobacteraceae bacterium 4572_88]